MKNILTIDLEDWYQGIELMPCQWSRYEDRLEWSARSLLQILDEKNTKATFFVLGYVAEKFPGLVRDIAELGHEIGTHGYGHEFVYTLTQDQFASDLERSIDCLEQATSAPIKVYRAPYFSITAQSIWAMEILAENGIEYDSSVFPIRNYRYGIPGAPRYLHGVRTRSGSLLEIPISTTKAFNGSLSFTGGFYLRFFPYPLIKRAIQAINNEGQPAVVYLHPWELDPAHPRLSLPLRVKLTHYHNLTSTEKKLRALLDHFQFAPVMDVVEKRKGIKYIEYSSSALTAAQPGAELWQSLD